MDPDPDPLIRDTDLGIRIRTKMSRIPNTDFNGKFLLFSKIMKVVMVTRDCKLRLYKDKEETGDCEVRQPINV